MGGTLGASYVYHCSTFLPTGEGDMTLDNLIAHFDTEMKKLMDRRDANDISDLEFNLEVEKLIQAEERAIAAKRLFG